MGNRIPEEVIENIRRSVDIVDVVSEYVQLKKQGRNYFGLCPFHDEKSPSFSVAPEKQIYHCFGCGAGGNVFSFLMEIEGLHYVEAVKRLGEKVNIEVPDVITGSIKQEQRSKSTDLMLEAHELLKKLYHHVLVNTKEGKAALDYLEGRGFTPEAIEHFQIGYAPDSWQFATTFLTKRGYDPALMVEAGLLAISESKGEYFDRFRNRVMFPISDHHGKTIAFGGRIVGHGEPKYLNSPETKVFNKSSILYGFHLARPMIRKVQEAVLFEGYADVVSAWKAGVANGVATMGTAITEEHARILRRNVDSVVVCYDSDEAGLHAAVKAIDALQAAGCYVKVALMPDGLDPDDYIKKFGAKRFQHDVIGASLTVTAFKIRYLRKGKNLQNEGERIRYIEEVLQEISGLSKAVERDHYLRQLADEFSLSLDALKQQQYQIYKQLHRSRDNESWKRNNNPRNHSFLTSKKLLPAYQNAERMLLAHMLYSGELSVTIQEQIGLSFNIDEHNAIAAYLYAYYEEGNTPDVSLFLERLNDQRLKRIVSDLAMMSINENISDKGLQDYIKQVLDYPKWLKIEEKEAEKQEAERQKDYVKAAAIAMEMIKMKRELKGS